MYGVCLLAKFILSISTSMMLTLRSQLQQRLILRAVSLYDWWHEGHAPVIQGVVEASQPQPKLGVLMAPAAAAWARRPFAKVAKHKDSKKGGDAAAEGAPPTHAAGVALEDYRGLMERAMEHLEHELANIRTGRATAGMLDHLKVDLYGERLPLKAVGSVSVRSPQLLVVTLFDPGAVDAVVSAIRGSPLQLTPRAEGQEISVPVQPPTAETLTALARVCRAEGEAAKVAVRHARKGAMEGAKALASEDERRRVEKEVQALTDKYVADVERLVASKQKDIAAHNS